MKVKDIKALPNEFSFKTRYGIGNIVYHARKRKFDYDVDFMPKGHRKCTCFR